MTTDNLEHMIGASGIEIYCPLSTSSSLTVFTMFTNNNHGLVVKFRGDDGGYAKYFSCAWLSNFPSESEYLFVQNDQKLKIDNIYSSPPLPRSH